MSDSPPRSERRLSTPLVLASVSAMLAVSAALLITTQRTEERNPTEATPPPVLRVDDSSPERVAESFYDAWRRRSWSAAEGISVGRARERVDEESARDAQLEAEDREMAMRMWATLAQAPLAMTFEQSEELDDERRRLTAVAEYQFVDRPYRRRVTFVVAVAGAQRYRIESMVLGEVLTPLPPMFEGRAPP